MSNLPGGGHIVVYATPILYRVHLAQTFQHTFHQHYKNECNNGGSENDAENPLRNENKKINKMSL